MIAISKPQTIGPAILLLLGEKAGMRASKKLIGGDGRERVSAGVRASYFPAKPLIENHNVVPSLSPGFPREAAANSPTIQNSTLKIQHCFSHPQTNPHPKSTLAHPKSTVDLGCEGLIRVENGLRPPLSPTYYRPKSGPKIKESNQNQTATNQKIYFASLIIPASRSILPPSPSTANEEFQVKTRPLFRHPILPYSTLCQPILPIFDPSFFTGHNQGSLFIAIFPFKAVQSHSRFFETFFYATSHISPLATTRDAPCRMELGSSLALGCCPKTFGVGAFTMVAVRKDQPIYLYSSVFTPPGGLFIPPCILQPLQTY
jgi:hypothetical protein